MSLICIRRQTPESDGTLDEIAKDLLSFFKGFKCLNKPEEKI